MIHGILGTRNFLENISDFPHSKFIIFGQNSNEFESKTKYSPIFLVKPYTCSHQNYGNSVEIDPNADRVGATLSRQPMVEMDVIEDVLILILSKREAPCGGAVHLDPPRAVHLCIC